MTSPWYSFCFLSERNGCSESLTQTALLLTWKVEHCVECSQGETIPFNGKEAGSWYTDTVIPQVSRRMLTYILKFVLGCECSYKCGIFFPPATYDKVYIGLSSDGGWIWSQAIFRRNWTLKMTRDNTRDISGNFFFKRPCSRSWRFVWIDYSLCVTLKRPESIDPSET